jgi:hypothetical protein
MAYDGNNDGLEHDFEVVEAIGGQLSRLHEAAFLSGAIQKAVRRWLLGHRDPPDDADELVWLTAMAADLEVFTPSMSGRTSVDRHLATRRPQSDLEHEAFDALAAARFRLVTIVGRDDPDRVRLRDLLTDEILVLLDSRISPLAAGMQTAMRLCPLRSGRQALISPLFEADRTLIAAAMTFARHGRLPGGGHRCAANLYRDAARAGFSPVPTMVGPLFDEDDFAEAGAAQTIVQHWLVHWGEAEVNRADLVAQIRLGASLENLVDACGLFGKAQRDAPETVREALIRIAEIQMETLARRARAGVGGYADVLDRTAARIDREVAAGNMYPAGRDIFGRLRARLAFAHRAAQDAEGSASRVELDRVIQRILALRAKTVDRGCTELEAMAAAEKVAELLARYDLTLDEVAVRQSPCTGLAVETQRRRRAPIDQCAGPVADFCDCHVWSEETSEGTRRIVFFGLKADVEAARFLFDVIEDTFETETGAFRRGAIYLGQNGGDRRTALNSFQIGLAHGIAGKLAAIKTARSTAAVRSTGFDLVAVKDDVVEEELNLLGLRFQRKARRSSRSVHVDAYQAGEAAGALFEPSPALGG